MGDVGGDPTGNKLARSSSIPNFGYPETDIGDKLREWVPLKRTFSLPTETEDEWRKKSLQILRRMEAKRKRSVKQRIESAIRERNPACFEEIFGDGCGLEVNCEKRSGLDGGGSKRGEQPPLPPPSRGGSNASQGTGSSGITESESRPAQGTGKCVKSQSPNDAPPLPAIKLKSPVMPGMTKIQTDQIPKEKRSNKFARPDKGMEENLRNLLVDMPYVSTKGDGPNGKRVEGFLYRYRKGEEVRIVCVFVMEVFLLQLSLSSMPVEVMCHSP